MPDFFGHLGIRIPFINYQFRGFLATKLFQSLQTPLEYTWIRSPRPRFTVIVNEIGISCLQRGPTSKSRYHSPQTQPRDNTCTSAKSKKPNTQNVVVNASDDARLRAPDFLSRTSRPVSVSITIRGMRKLQIGELPTTDTMASSNALPSSRQSQSRK